MMHWLKLIAFIITNNVVRLRTIRTFNISCYNKMFQFEEQTVQKYHKFPVKHKYVMPNIITNRDLGLIKDIKTHCTSEDNNVLIWLFTVVAGCTRRDRYGCV